MIPGNKNSLLEKQVMSSATFTITADQLEKLGRWQEIQDQKVADRQGRSFPNYGCAGGGYSYIFGPCGIGTTVRVQNLLTNDTIDLSDYDNW